MRRPPLFQSCGLWFFEGTTAIGEAEIGGGMASTPVNVQVEESVLAGKRTERPVSEKVSPEKKVSKTDSGVDVQPKQLEFEAVATPKEIPVETHVEPPKPVVSDQQDLLLKMQAKIAELEGKLQVATQPRPVPPSTPLALTPEPKPKATPSPSTHSNPDLPEEEDGDEEGNEEDMIIMPTGTKAGWPYQFYQI